MALPPPPTRPPVLPRPTRASDLRRSEALMKMELHEEKKALEEDAATTATSNASPGFTTAPGKPLEERDALRMGGSGSLANRPRHVLDELPPAGSVRPPARLPEKRVTEAALRLFRHAQDLAERRSMERVQADAESVGEGGRRARSVSAGRRRSGRSGDGEKTPGDAAQVPVHVRLYEQAAEQRKALEERKRAEEEALRARRRSAMPERARSASRTERREGDVHTRLYEEAQERERDEKRMQSGVEGPERVVHLSDRSREVLEKAKRAPRPLYEPGVRQAKEKEAELVKEKMEMAACTFRPQLDVDALPKRTGPWHERLLHQPIGVPTLPFGAPGSGAPSPDIANPPQVIVRSPEEIQALSSRLFREAQERSMRRVALQQVQMAVDAHAHSPQRDLVSDVSRSLLHRRHERIRAALDAREGDARRRASEHVSPLPLRTSEWHVLTPSTPTSASKMLFRDRDAKEEDDGEEVGREERWRREVLAAKARHRQNGALGGRVLVGGAAGHGAVDVAGHGAVDVAGHGAVDVAGHGAVDVAVPGAVDAAVPGAVDAAAPPPPSAVSGGAGTPAVGKGRAGAEATLQPPPTPRRSSTTPASNASSPARRSVRPEAVERLYRAGQRDFGELRRRKEELELEGCTFRPRTNSPGLSKREFNAMWRAAEARLRAADADDNNNNNMTSNNNPTPTDRGAVTAAAPPVAEDGEVAGEESGVAEETASVAEEARESIERPAESGTSERRPGPSTEQQEDVGVSIAATPATAMVATVAVAWDTDEDAANTATARETRTDLPPHDPEPLQNSPPLRSPSVVRRRVSISSSSRAATIVIEDDSD